MIFFKMQIVTFFILFVAKEIDKEVLLRSSTSIFWVQQGVDLILTLHGIDYGFQPKYESIRRDRWNTVVSVN